MHQFWNVAINDRSTTLLHESRLKLDNHFLLNTTIVRLAGVRLLFSFVGDGLFVGAIGRVLRFPRLGLFEWSWRLFSLLQSVQCRFLLGTMGRILRLPSFVLIERRCTSFSLLQSVQFRFLLGTMHCILRFPSLVLIEQSCRLLSLLQSVQFRFLFGTMLRVLRFPSLVVLCCDMPICG
jgi:hypothetical protein